MKILAFDTANNNVSVAISDDQVILAYIEEPRPSMQAETIVPMIESALQIAGMSYKELDYLAVTNGPGSFTGIRIGLSVAKAIILSTNIKGITVSNFEYSYFRASTQVKNYSKIFVFLNAYRKQLYSQGFNNDGLASKASLINYKQAVDLIGTAEEGTKICAGSGVELIYDQIKDNKNIIVLPRFAKVKALHICRYLATKLAITQALPFSPIEPLYIRPPDAKLPSQV
ncbi:tRNA (adenosine(37)-N6)-threonylcarbamoyltransferase complex dimerization subunit type 1 TsaB [Candidatus Tisiphia endosymbiont of Nemotelus uliginosus]|uniref:tRNA (adenosine(37)-N6)-threonylcarbamoyltransferase complex dimerization subunit type 1 TsaB n=1 Tax=Candidatus Tisiphia endosymbiont of Nemotelus uliginosus TaxID=3077926 RepID=UPI0035C8D1F0